MPVKKCPISISEAYNLNIYLEPIFITERGVGGSEP